VTRAYALFIGHREAVPHDGTRQIIADGHVERQDAGAGPADDALMVEMAAAVARIALQWMNGRQQREGERP
jgi:hypothetical protein